LWYLSEDSHVIPSHLTNPNHTRSHRTSLFPPEVHRAPPPLIAAAAHLQQFAYCLPPPSRPLWRPGVH
jgi:hypothetical protein